MTKKILLAAACVAFIIAGSDVSPAQYGRQPFSFPVQQPQEDYGLRFLLLTVPAVIGFLIGLLFSPALATVRKYIMLGILGLLVLFALFGPPILGEALSAVGGFVASIVSFFVALRLFSRRKKRRLWTFGSAQWADRDHIKENGLDGDEGFHLGSFVDPAMGRNAPVVTLRYKGERHLTTIAPTRSEKGVSAIIPNLLSYPGSALVVDPKGENALITMFARSRMGQRIHVVDPWGIVAKLVKGLPVARFNPLDWLKTGDPDIAENAMLLADALVVKGNSQDQFWDEEAKALLMGLILHVALDEPDAKSRNLGRVRDLLMQDSDGLTDLFTRMYNSKNRIVSGTGARSLQKDSKLLSNVLAATQAHTHFLESPRIRESLSQSDFSFEDLKTSLVTVYLVLPSDRLVPFARWLRLLIQQAITVNARNLDYKPPRPILFLLDEMPALGHLAMVEQAYSLMAGFGMQVWAIVQDASQLKKIYGDSWETFIANSGVIQYFGSRDSMTSEYFSKLCGISTIVTITSSISRVIATALGQGGSASESTSFADTQRNLANPDELMRLPSNKQLLLVENMDPISAMKVRWYEDSRFREQGFNLHEYRKRELENRQRRDSGDSSSTKNQSGRGSPASSRPSSK